MSLSKIKRRNAWYLEQEKKKQAEEIDVNEAVEKHSDEELLDGDNELTDAELEEVKPEQVEEREEAQLSIEEVKAKLDELEVKYAHNTGEEKLREKLADATK